MNPGNKFNRIQKRMKRIVKIVALDGATFTGEICGNDSKGLLLREERSSDSDNPIFISHHAISYIKVIGWSKKTLKKRR